MGFDLSGSKPIINKKEPQEMKDILKDWGDDLGYTLELMYGGGDQYGIMLLTFVIFLVIKI